MIDQHTEHLRDYQAEAFHLIRRFIGQSIRDKIPPRPVLMAPCAWGKTQLSAAMTSAALERGNRSLFVVDNLELVEQTIATFESRDLTVGVIQGEHEQTDYAAGVQIATAQTLAARIKRYRRNFERYPIGLIIHDECHVQYASREKLAELYPKVPTVGLSATPFSKGMGKFYTGLIQTATSADLVERGCLTPLKVWSHEKPDFSGIPYSANGMLKAKPAGERYTPHIVGDIIKTWRQTCGHMSTIAFATDVAASRRLAMMFQAAGVNAVHIDGYGGSDKDKADRAKIIEEFKAGKIQVLCNVGIAVKGFDAPIAECLIDCQPGKSLSRHIQKLGRIMRLFAGKQYGHVLDFAGNCILNGLPTDPMPDKLHMGKKNEASKDRKVVEKVRKTCSKCKRLKEISEHVCVQCGFAPERIADAIYSEDGKLVLYEPGDQIYPARVKEEWMRMFRHYADSKGKKPGYAIFLYKAKFGEEPKVRFPKSTIAPNKEVKKFIQHRNIAYARKREKEAALG